MRAAVLNAPGDLTIEHLQRPAAGGDVLVRVTHSGVCGTDLKIYQGAISVHHPLIMGHEMIGEVIAGGEARGLEKGERVIVDPVHFCGACFHCQAGQTHLCPQGTLLGRDRDGGFAEYLVVSPENLYSLPDSISDRAAPLIQVLTTCVHAQRLAPIFPGEAVVVLGLGVTGQMHLQLAKARGAYPVIGVTRSAWKRDLAGQLGADLTFPTGPEARAGVLEATGGRGADLVIECAGALPALAEAITLARAGGRLLIFGITTATEGRFPFYQLYYKELAIINSRAAKGEDYPVSIDLVRRGAVQLEPLISHSLSLGELEVALQLVASQDSSPMKIILEHT